MGPFERIQGFAGICTSRYGDVGLTVQVGPLGIRAEKLRVLPLALGFRVYGCLGSREKRLFITKP